MEPSGIAQDVCVCGTCKASSPPQSHFCCNCGVPFEDPDRRFVEQIRSVLKAELKDQKVVEIETTQLVVSRVSEWAKLFAFFTAVPVAFLLGGLAIWGVTKFADVNEKLKGAQERATSLASTSELLRSRYEQLETNVARYESLGQRLDAVAARSETLGQQLNSLRTDVSEIGQRVGFMPSKALTPAMQRSLESALANFETYLRPLGYTPPGRKTDVEVVERIDGGATTSTSSGRITVTAGYLAGDEGNILKPYMDVVLGENHSMSWDSAPSYFATRLGLECYFPASFLSRKLQTCAFDERSAWPASVRTNDDINRGGRIWTGALWTARAEVPAADLDRAVFQAWVASQGDVRAQHFEQIFARAILARLGTNAGRVEPILRDQRLLP